MSPPIQPAVTISIPERVARYHEEYLSVARYARVYRRGDPRRRTDRRFTEIQELFLCDLAQAFHNLLSRDGAVFFFREAKRINAEWAPLRGELLANDHGDWFHRLVPMPEAEGEEAA